MCNSIFLIDKLTFKQSIVITNSFRYYRKKTINRFLMISSSQEKSMNINNLNYSNVK